MSLDPLAQQILDFWFTPRDGESGGEGLTRAGHIERDVWFRKDDAFDAETRTRFGVALAAGIAGAYGGWCTTPRGSLARVILLDQFPRNAFRGTRDAFAGDPGAIATAEDAIAQGFDRSLEAHERWFLYMPFQHSESLPMQERSRMLFRTLAAETGLESPLRYVERHYEIIRRFGRFPHRNAILGRASTPEELAFLREPGSGF
jgi:uncharacterized protein (DUF924 family)